MVAIKTYNIKIKDMDKFQDWFMNHEEHKFLYEKYGFDVEINGKITLLPPKCILRIYKY